MAVVLILFIASLWLLGVVVGPCCYSKDKSPTERNGCSNCAGILLMS